MLVPSASALLVSLRAFWCFHTHTSPFHLHSYYLTTSAHIYSTSKPCIRVYVPHGWCLSLAPWCACHVVSARTQHHVQNRMAPSPACPWCSQSIRSHPCGTSEVSETAISLCCFLYLFLGQALLVPVISRPSVCAMHLTELQLLVRALQRALRAAGEAWGNGTGAADRQTPASPMVSATVALQGS